MKGESARWKHLHLDMTSPSDNQTPGDVFDDQFLHIQVFDENVVATSIEDLFKYFKNYATHIMLQQVSPSIWINMSNISATMLIIFAALETASWLSIAIMYTVLQYEEGRTRTYISDQSTAGDCTAVTRLVGEKQYVSKGADGGMYWESSKDYTTNSTIYSVELSNYRSDPSTLVSFFTGTAAKLQEKTAVGRNRSLAWNLILMSTFTDIRNSPITGRYTFRIEGNVMGRLPTSSSPYP